MRKYLLALAIVALVSAGCDAAPTTGTSIEGQQENSKDARSELAPEKESFPTPNLEKEITSQPKLTPSPENKKPSPSCDPNYSGCVPIASDVDCSSGSGNGPAYTGRTTVIGTDIYDLDRDGDGVACE